MKTKTLLAAIATCLIASSARAIEPAAKTAAVAALKRGLEKPLDQDRLSAAVDAAVAALGADAAAARRLIDAVSEGKSLNESARLIDAVRDDLAFRPKFEAELPPEFPTFTTVGEIEIKRYPTYRLARVSMKSSNSAFFTLFRHIQENEVKMTAPVQIDRDGDRRSSTMAFLYERPDQGSTGTDGVVEVVDIPAATVISVGLRGRQSEAIIESARRALEGWIERNGRRWERAGPMRTMGYNSPMVFGKRRYYEVQIPIRPVADEESAE